MYVIYLATNTKNGKRYVGATKQGLKSRKKKHEWDAVHGRAYCRVFHAALRKYGPAAFKWDVLKTCSFMQEAMDEEIAMIATLKPEYNIAQGGRGIIGVPRTAEWLENMSRALKGRKMSPERVAQIKASVRPEAHHKPVVCLDDGLWFESVKAAANHYGISQGNVSTVARGVQTISKGVAFVFSSTPLSDDERVVRLSKLKAKRVQERDRRKAGFSHRPVICLNTGVRYPSAKDAEAALGVPRIRVGQMCRDGGRTKAGLRFMFADAAAPPPVKQRTPDQQDADRQASIAALVRGQKKIKKRVVCLDTGIVYESITAAARSCGASVQMVSEAIYRGGKAYGLSFRFAKGNRR